MFELVSIIVPAYNSEKYIERCLESILKQSYSKIEVIVVDDGSTDNTLSVCSLISKKDSRLKVFHKQNEGVSIARLYGVEKSTGQYIGFVDADDTIENNMIQTLIKIMHNNNADIVHCGFKIIKQDTSIAYFYNTLEFRVQDHDSGIIDLISAQKVEPSLCTKLFKSSLFNHIVKDIDLRINEDYILNLYLFNVSLKNVFIDIPYYNYFQNIDSASRKNLKEYWYKDILKAADITLQMFENDEKIYPFALKKWFNTYSDMYKSYYKYDFNSMEFDLRLLLEDVYNKILIRYPEIKALEVLQFRDRFILFSLKHFPKILLILCRIW